MFLYKWVCGWWHDGKNFKIKTLLKAANCIFGSKSKKPANGIFFIILVKTKMIKQKPNIYSTKLSKLEICAIFIEVTVMLWKTFDICIKVNSPFRQSKITHIYFCRWRKGFWINPPRTQDKLNEEKHFRSI